MNSVTRRSRRAGCLIVCPALLAMMTVPPLVRGAAPEPKEPAAGAAGVARYHATVRVPNFFCFDYNFDPHPGRRLWLRVTETQWVERYPDGRESRFEALGRAKVYGKVGTIVVKVAGDPLETGTTNEGSFQVFIPDRDYEEMRVLFRHVGLMGWTSLAIMEKVE